MTGVDVSDPVLAFVTRTVTALGGLVEPVDGGIETLLPRDAAERLGLGEEAMIQLASTGEVALPGDRVHDGRIGSALLERLVALRLERPAITALELPAGLPVALPEKLPVLLNAVRAGIPERHRILERFLVIRLRVTLQGEELRSALVPVTIRLDDGARVIPFSMSGAYSIHAAPLDAGQQERARSALDRWLVQEAPRVHSAAFDTLRRRARRDLDNIAQYYSGLDAEMGKAAGRARAVDERARRHAKWAALPHELASRREQLRSRIRSRLSARVVAATLVQCDVERFDVTIRRRNRTGTASVRYRTADGVFEGPACSACGVATLTLYLCDERMHVLCTACGHAGRLDAARCRTCNGSATQHTAPQVMVDDPTAGLRLGPQDAISHGAH